MQTEGYLFLLYFSGVFLSVFSFATLQMWKYALHDITGRISIKVLVFSRSGEGIWNSKLKLFFFKLDNIKAIHEGL